MPYSHVCCERFPFFFLFNLLSWAVRADVPACWSAAFVSCERTTEAQVEAAFTCAADPGVSSANRPTTQLTLLIVCVLRVPALGRG